MLSEFLLFLGAALLLTLAIEVGVVLLLGFRDRRFILVVALASVVTNPPLNLVVASYRQFIHAEVPIVVMLVLEGIVILVEGFILVKVFPRYSWRSMLVLSFVMNATSFGLGMVSQSLFMGTP